MKGYKIKLQQQFDEAWFAGVGDKYHGKYRRSNPISMMKCNIECLQWHVVNGTACANNQPSDMKLGMYDCSPFFAVTEGDDAFSIHKVRMWCTGNSARPPGDLFRQHRLIVNYSTGLSIGNRFQAASHSWETNSTNKGNKTPLKENSARKSKFWYGFDVFLHVLTMRVHAKFHEHVIFDYIFHGRWCRLIVVCSTCVCFTCTKRFMPSDDLSLSRCKSCYQEIGITWRFQNLVRSWCEQRHLIVV